MGALIDQVDEYYVRIRFDNALATAKTPIDITRIDKLFELEIVDPAQQKSVTVTNTDLQGATGTITLYKYALQDNYRISFDLQVHDMHLEGTTRSNSNPPSSTAAATITTRSIWHPRPV